jgi:molybdate/tungstate transport system permease protein
MPAPRPRRSQPHWDPLQLVFALLGGLVLLFIVAPLLGLFFQGGEPADIVSAAGNAELRKSIWLTLWTSMAATAVLSVAAVPFAYLLARRDFMGKRLVLGLVDLPTVIPHSAAGIAILTVVARSAPFGAAANAVGVELVGHPAGIMIAMAFVSIPFLINAARDGFQAVPERLEKAALTLGASPLRVFLTIALPLAWRAILSGFVLMWARGMSEFGAVVVVAYHPMITPVLIWEWFGAYGLSYARPAAALFVLVCLVLFILLRLLGRERHDA